jgi:hypothetical protein
VVPISGIVAVDNGGGVNERWDSSADAGIVVEPVVVRVEL